MNSTNYVSVQGQYAVVNEGTSYAIINTQTQQTIARNISSFLDFVKTIEYLSSKETLPIAQVSPSPPINKYPQTPNFGVREDVQRLIERYAPQTVRVEKKSNSQGSRYKCYDSNGYCIGRVKGKLGDRYWEDSSGKKY